MITGELWGRPRQGRLNALIAGLFMTVKIISCKGEHCWKKKTCLRYNPPKKMLFASYWPMPPTNNNMWLKKCSKYYANLGQKLPSNVLI